jgi:hypothetical protein
MRGLVLVLASVVALAERPVTPLGLDLNPLLFYRDSLSRSAGSPSITIGLHFARPSAEAVVLSNFCESPLMLSFAERAAVLLGSRNELRTFSSP